MRRNIVKSDQTIDTVYNAYLYLPGSFRKINTDKFFGYLKGFSIDYKDFGVDAVNEWKIGFTPNREATFVDFSSYATGLFRFLPTVENWTGRLEGKNVSENVTLIFEVKRNNNTIVSNIEANGREKLIVEDSILFPDVDLLQHATKN